MPLQARERARAGRVALPRRQEAGPRPGKLQQADGMTRRRGVEDDMVIPAGQALVSQGGGLDQQPPANRCSSWRSPCRATGTSLRTPTRSGGLVVLMPALANIFLL